MHKRGEVLRLAMGGLFILASLLVGALLAFVEVFNVSDCGATRERECGVAGLGSGFPVMVTVAIALFVAGIALVTAGALRGHLGDRH